MEFGFIGILFLFKLKFQKVSIILIFLYLFLPDLIYLGLLILEWYSLNQFPPASSPQPAQWSHSLFINGIIICITAAIIIIKRKNKSNLILGTLPALHILLDSFSIFYAVYYFYPFLEGFNTLSIYGYYQYNEYLKSSYGQYTAYGMSVWPLDAIYWVIDLLTLFFCILFCIWRVAKTEFEEKPILKVYEDLIIPFDYSLIYNYPKIESISFDENRVFTQQEWISLTKRARGASINFRLIKEEKLDLEYKYPEFEGQIPRIEKSLLKNYNKTIKKIFKQLNFKDKLGQKEIIINSLKNPLIHKGKLFQIQVKTAMKIEQRELLYISPNGVLFFLNRGEDNLIKFNYILKNEEIKIEKIEQILRMVQLFIELFGCFRERILYSNQEIDGWRLYDYRNPDITYEINGLPINSVEIYKLENSFGIILWTWADYFSKWALIYYQFQLFPEGLRPEIFPFYRIPIYAGVFSQDD